MDQVAGTLLADPRLRGPLTVDRYYQLAREGIIPADARVELIEGELVWMNAIGSPHASAVRELARVLTFAVGMEAIVSVQSPIRLDNGSEPEPDLALLAPRADRYRNGHPSAREVLLLVEVADTSLGYDRGRKRALYARHGIAEFWIVDIEAARVEVFRDPAPGGYASERIEGIDAVLHMAALPGVLVPVREFLP